MTGQELLLNELTERERLLGDQIKATRRAETLLSVMDALNDCADIEAGVIRVLEICCAVTKAELAVLLRPDGEDRMETLLASDPVFGLPAWSLPPGRMQRIYRVTDTALTPLFSNLPAETLSKRSLLSVPVAADEGPAMALIVLSDQCAHFSADDQSLIERVGGIIARAMQNWRLSERNAVLSAILQGEAALPHAKTGTDSSFEALSLAFDRLTDWQNRIVQINNALLGTPADTIDKAIDQTLADIGQLADSDRTYVFRLRAPDRLDNTHEWVGPGIEPMIDKLQDLPDDLMGDWRADFEAGRPVYIADVDALPPESSTREILQMQGIRSLLAVPMSRDGALTGFVGHDAVHRRRRFLPAEIRLLQSVSNTISVIMDRREAEEGVRRAKTELAQERDRLAATLAALPDLLLELDSDGRFIGCYFGGSLGPAFPPEAFIGRLAEEVLPPDLAMTLRQMMQEVDANGICGANEYPMRLQGEERWFAASVGARRNAGGANGYIFLIRDVTESHQSQRELRRLGEIAKLTSNLVVITDVAGKIEWVNPAFERRSGWTSHEVIGQKPGDFLQFEKTDRRTVQRISKALKRGEAVQAELLNRSRDGVEYWVSKDIQPLIDCDGQVEGFVAVQTDITALKESHQREILQRAVAIDASTDGIAISNRHGKYVYMNRSHRQMFGISETEDIRNLGWTDLTTPSGVERFLRGDMPKLQADRRWRGEMRGLHRSGAILDLEVTLTLTDDDDLVCIARDVTERNRFEADRVRLREELQLAQKREAVSQVASGVAHDLNNLVAVVLGTVSLLQLSARGDSELTVSLRRIGRAMDAAQDLVDRLGSLERPDVPRGQHDLRTLVIEAIDLLGAERVRRHMVHADLPNSSQNVWANRTELLQVIVNLALNACDAGGDTSSKVTISVLDEKHAAPARFPDVGETEDGVPQTLFQVTDTGAGVDPAIRPRLFERYVTTKGKAGTGLGLPIVASILRDCGGALWFDSTPGEGSTVTVAWPSEERRKSRPEPPAEPDTTPRTLSGFKILVVDDNPDVAAVLSGMLEAHGAVSVAINDPFEARSVIMENPGAWSALVTDFDMPGLDGAHLARVASKCTPAIPCILVTALPESSGWDRSLFHEVHAKPLKRDIFVESVRDAILKNKAAQ